MARLSKFDRVSEWSPGARWRVLPFPEALVKIANTAAEGASVIVADAAGEKLNEAAAGGGYWNADLAPVPHSARRWGLKDVAALWVSLSACVPTYMLASSLVEGA